VRKLIYLLGKKDPSSVDEKDLVSTAESMKNSDPLGKSYDMTSFFSKQIKKDRISNTMKSVSDLMEALINSAAKGRRKIIIDLVPTREEEQGLVMAEYVMSDSKVVIGRINFGSSNILETILKMIKEHVCMVLIDMDKCNGSWIGTKFFHSSVSAAIGHKNVRYYSFENLQEYNLLETVLAYKSISGSDNILICGDIEQLIRFVPRMSKYFTNIFINTMGKSVSKDAQRLGLLGNCTEIEIPADWKNLNLDIGLILKLSFTRDIETDNISRGLGGFPYILYAYGAAGSEQNELPDRQSVIVDPNRAYIGMYSRLTIDAEKSDGQEEIEI